MPNIVNETSGAIELLNAEDLAAGARFARVQLGCMVLHLRKNDLPHLKRKVQECKPSGKCQAYGISLGRCHFVLTAGGRERLLAVLREIDAARRSVVRREREQCEKERLLANQQQIIEQWRKAFQGGF